MDKATTETLSKFVDSFKADHWRVQLKNRLTEQAFRFEYTSEQLVKSVAFLRWKNREGFDIYVRPIGWQYVLLDDLTHEVLASLAELEPCALIETSLDNFQAWLILPNVPCHREEARAICRELAQRFKADPASADPDHVGRLPGYTNRKEKHQKADGQYPFVRLRRSMYRVSNFHPSGGPVLEENEIVKSSSRNASGSESEKDFGIACGLIRKGLTDEQVLTYLLTNSPNLEQRKGVKHVESYLLRTIREARKASGTRYS